MILTEVKFNKKGTFDIYADGEYICDIDDETVYKMKLKKGVDISEETLSLIQQLSQEQGAKKAGAKILSSAMKSRFDFEKKLTEKGFEKSAVKKAADFFEEKGFLNDEAYAKAYVTDAIKLKRFGTSKIRMVLKSKGIAEDVISDVLADVQDFGQENLKILVEKELAKITVRDKKSMDRIKRRLYAKGYGIGEIIQAINEAGGEEFEN